MVDVLKINKGEALSVVVLMAGLILDDIFNIAYVIAAGIVAVALGYGLGKALFG